MNNHILVCPFDEKLISKLSGNTLVVRTTKYSLINNINRVVNEHNKLHCLIYVNKKDLLSSMTFMEEWIDIPIALYIAGLGKFKEIECKLSFLNKMSIRVFFTSNTKHNITELKILSSMGINCGLIFSKTRIDWNRVNDLMHYAIYNRASHATIEPFHYVVSHYNAQNPTDFSSVYFDNPQRYLHIDNKENIALSYTDLMKGNFIAKGIGSIECIVENKKYNEALGMWRDVFLHRHKCSYCPAWRICLGKFSESYSKGQGCRELFSDLMDAAEFYQTQRKNNKYLCQL